ncbi:hypothetical protein PIB30_056552 [Stylosanthes scabra]|uniref:Replication factor A C-terminal domain-containing protein n=1 Tax=Stylosanthes scabra TaxID=79078 RepID=A0ABU6WJW3_9FABA|nr:hypothetical protein [Stylosanthes scabra]
MAVPGHIFEMVHPANSDNEFCLYIIRLWESPSKYNTKDIQSIEMVVEDCKRQRTHVSVPKGLLKRWRVNLHEFKCYRIKNLMVVDPKMKPKLRTIPCIWYLAFSHRTTVQILEPVIFPCNLFRFRTVLELNDKDVVLTNDTFDFIGEVVKKEDPRDVVTNTGLRTKRVVVVLQDTELIAPYLEKPQEEPLVVILQYFKVSRWNGKTSVQSNFELSKAYINAEFKEVVEFRNRLETNGPTLSGRISQVQSEGASTGAKELINGRATVHTIKEVSMLTKQCQPWISVEIMALNVGSNDWWYTACGGYAKKVGPQEGSSSDTKRCDKDDGERTERYKVEAIAHDNIGCINLLMWDREAKKLCGKLAEDVKKEKIEAEDDYPPSLNNMLERKLLFKIHVKNSNINEVDTVFPVIKLIDDKDLITRFTPANKPPLQGSLEAGNISNLSTELSGSAINLMADSYPQYSVGDVDEAVSTIKAKIPAKTDPPG